MAFSYASVYVSDCENDRVVNKPIADPSELRELIDMERSYKVCPDLGREIVTDKYFYEVNLARDGCKLDVLYAAPTDINVRCASRKAGLYAELNYDRASHALRVLGVHATFRVNEAAAEPPTDAAVAKELSRVVAMFRVVGEIAPLTVAEGAEVAYGHPIHELAKSLGAAAGFGDLPGETSPRAAALRERVQQQIADYDVLAKLR